MKPGKLPAMLVLGFILTACGGGASTDSGQTNTADLSSQEQAEMVATALSASKGGVEEDIVTAAQAATGSDRQQSQAHSVSYGYSISITVDFYDEQGVLQPAYDPQTTDRIDYQSLIQGQITNGTGFFTELSLDNRADFTLDHILSGIALINGTHTNHSSYSRTQQLTKADVHFKLDSELILTDVTVDLGASDTFPESGTVEGALTGSYERVAPTWRQSSQFNFHFIATYLGDNTAEVVLGDGTTFIVHLDNGSVENLD